MEIEIYIDNQLCDLDSSNISMRFKRAFINPAELNTKDAQKSYNITFPATARNNKIFGYVNIEETEGKFSKIYDNALVYVDSVKVFDGKFRLDEIGPRYYKGNLGVPALTTVKDVFGDTVMSEAGEWLIPFTGEDDMSIYNNKADSECIFPLVLYSLFPKDPINNNYTPKTDYDDTVSLGLDDFRPSVNVIQMLRKIFENAKYRLQGSALSDEKLRKLYVSYKNPNNYQPQWNPRNINISGIWGKNKDGHEETKVSFKEVTYYGPTNNHDGLCANVNILNSDNKILNYDITNPHIKNGKIVIPISGLYKIKLSSKLYVDDRMSGGTQVTVDNNNFEIKVNRYSDIKDIEQERLSNSFYIDNQNQYVNNPSNTDIFPRNKGVNFIDIKQSPTMLCGLAWGSINQAGNYNNPMASDNYNFMALKGAAINSSGYTYRDGTPANKFNISLDNAPVNSISKIDDYNGHGDISTVAYLEKGDIIAVVSSSCCESGIIRWYNHTVSFDLSIEPFRMEKEWIKIDNEYNSSGSMDWNDDSNFIFDKINLIKFLPTNIKVNDWIDNFCKAFNLVLTNESGNIFSLDVKNRTLVTKLSNIIDLDKKASVCHKKNQPLSLPYLYDIGFTIDTNEEGYIQTNDTGGGLFYTGVNDSKTPIEQKSDFSYTWFKDINYKIDNTVLKVPVITEHDIWENNSDDYEEMVNNEYYDLPQRFWYKDYVKNIRLREGKSLDIAFVKRESNGIILDYENKADSISSVYFLLLNNTKSYTTVKCYLTAYEYDILDKSLIRYNGDLYHVSEIDGYDPTGKNTGTLKLIKRII